MYSSRKCESISNTCIVPPTANPCRITALKIRRLSFRQGHQTLVEEIAVVLVAGHRQDRRVVDEAPTLHRFPRRGESARILDIDGHVHRLSVGSELPALG